MRNILLSRKGQVGSLAPAIIALTIAAFFLVMGLIILQETRNTEVMTQVYSNTTTNESIANVSTFGTLATPNNPNLAGGARPGANSFTITTCVEGNDSHSTIPSSNYTVSDAGLLRFTGAAHEGWNGTAWNCTYSYKYGDTAWTQTNVSVEGVGSFADFWEIIVLTIVIVIVLTIIIVAFGMGARRS